MIDRHAVAAHSRPDAEALTETASTPETASVPRERLEERFVLHWGEMASAWGINRTMGQIHALLYISEGPLTTDEIILRLGISRGGASTNLRALEEWGVVQRCHVKGDRREYFRPLTDSWDLFHIIVRERKRREFDPMLRSLRQFLTECDAEREPGLQHYQDRIHGLLDVLQALDQACERWMPRDPRELPRLLEVDVEGLL